VPVRFFLFLLLSALLPSAAFTDIRAVYSAGLGRGYAIEIADNGNLRADVDSGLVLLVRDGQAYLIHERLTGPVVTRAEDLTGLWEERAAALAAKKTAAPDTWPFVEQGRKVVNGRSGSAFFVRQHDGNLSSEPVLVMGDDPALMLLGPIMARIHRIEMQRYAASEQGTFGGGAALLAALLPRIEKGVPLQVFRKKLVSVETLPIEPGRFALPAEPEARATMRARIALEEREEAEERDNPRPATDNIAEAIFALGRLWLLDDSGKLTTIGEGENSRRPEDPKGRVIALCRGAAGPVVLTSSSADGSIWTMQRWLSGRWEDGPTVKGGGEIFIALSCGPEGEMLLTDQRMIEIKGMSASALRIDGNLRRALVGPSVLVTPDHVFLGLNAGEWGGGLRRIDRRSGEVAILERNVTGDLCDGPLNSSCDPVHAIAPVPWKPHCVAVAIGLIHMMSQGRVAEICGDRIEPLYAKPMLGSSPESQTALAKGASEESIAFFGLVRLGESLLAVGQDGLYRFGRPGAPAFQPLPRFRNVGGVLVSFELPDAVLVITRINQRASVSGGAPIIVAR
jgi:hypothetical protein